MLYITFFSRVQIFKQVGINKKLSTSRKSICSLRNYKDEW